MNELTKLKKVEKNQAELNYIPVEVTYPTLDLGATKKQVKHKFKEVQHQVTQHNKQVSQLNCKQVEQGSYAYMVFSGHGGIEKFNEQANKHGLQFAYHPLKKTDLHIIIEILLRFNGFLRKNHNNALDPDADFTITKQSLAKDCYTDRKTVYNRLKRLDEVGIIQNVKSVQNHGTYLEMAKDFLILDYDNLPLTDEYIHKLVNSGEIAPKFLKKLESRRFYWDDFIHSHGANCPMKDLGGSENTLNTGKMSKSDSSTANGFGTNREESHLLIRKNEQAHLVGSNRGEQKKQESPCQNEPDTGGEAKREQFFQKQKEKSCGKKEKPPIKPDPNLLKTYTDLCLRTLFSSLYPNSEFDQKVINECRQYVNDFIKRFMLNDYRRFNEPRKTMRNHFGNAFEYFSEIVRIRKVHLIRNPNDFQPFPNKWLDPTQECYFKKWQEWWDERQASKNNYNPSPHRSNKESLLVQSLSQIIQTKGNKKKSLIKYWEKRFDQIKDKDKTYLQVFQKFKDMDFSKKDLIRDFRQRQHSSS
jgi:hypothetical protein